MHSVVEVLRVILHVKNMGDTYSNILMYMYMYMYYSNTNVHTFSVVEALTAILHQESITIGLWTPNYVLR